MHILRKMNNNNIFTYINIRLKMQSTLKSERYNDVSKACFSMLLTYATSPPVHIVIHVYCLLFKFLVKKSCCFNSIEPFCDTNLSFIVYHFLILRSHG